MPHFSTKSYGHELGLSATFRQWRADSHCQQLHGYALAVSFKFGCKELDERNWVVDFGSLKQVKAWLCDMFDHKTLVARDDPYREYFRQLGEVGIAHIVLVDAVGCEAFAKMIHDRVSDMMKEKYGNRVWVQSVEVREHGANSAIYERPVEAQLGTF